MESPLKFRLKTCRLLTHVFEIYSDKSQDGVSFDNTQLKKFNSIYHRSIRKLEKLLNSPDTWGTVVDVFEEEYLNQKKMKKYKSVSRQY